MWLDQNRQQVPITKAQQNLLLGSFADNNKSLTISLFYAEQKISLSLLQVSIITYHELLEKNIEEISMKCHHLFRSS